MKYNKFPARIRDLKEVRAIFFDLVDDTSINLIAKKVSKMNGDVRVAFDLMKSSLSKLFYTVKDTVPVVEDAKIRVTYGVVLEVFEDKYGSKIYETLIALPRQDITVLEAISRLFDNHGEEKKLSFTSLYSEVEQECKY